MTGAEVFPRPEEGLEVEPAFVADLLERRARPDGTRFVLVDCREEDEHAYAHIRGDVLVPLSRFADEIGRALPDVTVPVVVYCHHGMRSARAAHHLRTRGWFHTFSLRGGIEAWSTEVDAAVPRY
jgi:adenylyltransferase/sulfurtransferase